MPQKFRFPSHTINTILRNMQQVPKVVLQNSSDSDSQPLETGETFTLPADRILLETRSAHMEERYQE